MKIKLDKLINVLPKQPVPWKQTQEDLGIGSSAPRELIAAEAGA